MIEQNRKYGCLTVIDSGEEYKQTELYQEWIDKFNGLRHELAPYFSEIQDIKEHYPRLFDENENRNFSEAEKNARIQMRFLYEKYCFSLSDYKKMRNKVEKHYKCVCKCGKVHYFNVKTIESKPRFCIYPIPISNRFTYSISAQNATFRKERKYEGIETVILCDKSKCYPSEDYCQLFNKYKEKQLIKKEEQFNLEIAQIPRTYAKNYDVDFSGKQYESLFIKECTNERLESKPSFSYTQFHHKHWHTITVYKQYRCICGLCGKEQLITCDKFGIYPPTEYGYHAYHGYWSEVSCDCHYISSFQWIVTKLLMENCIPYQAEYSFDDLFGIAGKNNLRFDFAVFNNDGSIKALIECQGEQHYQPVEEFGGEYAFDNQKKNDQLKREYADKNKIKVIEISYKDKQYERIQGILTENGII